MPVLKAVRMAMAGADSASMMARALNAGPKAATPAGPPQISSGGVVPVDSTTGTIQPGEWVSIYGNNLSDSTYTWNGDFPTSLGKTSVTINGKPAYMMYVSPTQINVQAPDDTATGQVAVVVQTPGGSATAYVTLENVAPAFALLYSPGSKGEFVAGIIPRTDGSGAYGGGTYDILGPGGNLLGFNTVPARPGDSVELYGFGFGPTNPPVPAGQLFSGAASVTSNFQLSINGVSINPTFVGISSAGLYQINFVVPANLGNGDLPIGAMVAGKNTQTNVFFPAVPNTTTNPYSSGGYGTTGGIGFPGTFYFNGGNWGFASGPILGTPGPVGPVVTGPGGPVGTGGFVGGTGGFGGGTGGAGGGTGGGSGGGSGGGYAVHKPMSHVPRMRFGGKPAAGSSTQQQ